jgi:hypothetical protein
VRSHETAVYTTEPLAAGRATITPFAPEALRARLDAFLQTLGAAAGGDRAQEG